MEVWKDVKGFEGLYQVSNTGKVKSLGRVELMTGRHEDAYYRKRGERLLSQRNGVYKNVNLYKNSEAWNKLVHRLVAETFLENPLCLPEVNHLDENKFNNHLDNLEWADRRGNALHSVHKTSGSNCPTSKLIEVDVYEIMELLTQGQLTQKEIGKMYNVSNHAIFRIKAGDNWAWLTGFGKEGNRT